MAHGTRISGTQKSVTAGFTRIDGVNKKITKGLTLVDGVRRNIPFVSNEIVGNLAIGTSVFTNIGGTQWEFLVVNQGKPSNMYDDSCNGTWLLMKDIYIKRAYSSDKSGNYGNAAINTYLNNDFIGLFDDGIQDKIKPVKIPYFNGSGVSSGSSGLDVRSFLLGGYEVGFKAGSPTGAPETGACLEYFSDGENSTRIAYFEGDKTAWFTRDPHSLAAASYAIGVKTSGASTNSLSQRDSNGIRPAIILPFDTEINENFNLVA